MLLLASTVPLAAGLIENDSAALADSLGAIETDATSVNAESNKQSNQLVALFEAPLSFLKPESDQ
jgi:hypothetical protein